MTMSMAPVFSSTYSTRSQLAPPSVVLKTPRSSLGPKRCPTAAAYATSGSPGWSAILATWRVSAKPTSVHVRPPSVDLKTPHPYWELCRFCGSPVPAHTTFGFAWKTVTSPMDEHGWSSKRGVHDIPLFSVSHTPPEPRPT